MEDPLSRRQKRLAAHLQAARARQTAAQQRADSKLGSALGTEDFIGAGDVGAAVKSVDRHSKLANIRQRHAHLQVETGVDWWAKNAPVQSFPSSLPTEQGAADVAAAAMGASSGGRAQTLDSRPGRFLGENCGDDELPVERGAGLPSLVQKQSSIPSSGGKDLITPAAPHPTDNELPSFGVEPLCLSLRFLAQDHAAVLSSWEEVLLGNADAEPPTQDQARHRAVRGTMHRRTSWVSVDSAGGGSSASTALPRQDRQEGQTTPHSEISDVTEIARKALQQQQRIEADGGREAEKREGNLPARTFEQHGEHVVGPMTSAEDVNVSHGCPLEVAELTLRPPARSEVFECRAEEAAETSLPDAAAISRLPQEDWGGGGRHFDLPESVAQLLGSDMATGILPWPRSAGTCPGTGQLLESVLVSGLNSPSPTAAGAGAGAAAEEGGEPNALLSQAEEARISMAVAQDQADFQRLLQRPPPEYFPEIRSQEAFQADEVNGARVFAVMDLQEEVVRRHPLEEAADMPIATANPTEAAFAILRKRQAERSAARGEYLAGARQLDDVAFAVPPVAEVAGPGVGGRAASPAVDAACPPTLQTVPLLLQDHLPQPEAKSIEAHPPVAVIRGNEAGVSGEESAASDESPQPPVGPQSIAECPIGEDSVEAHQTPVSEADHVEVQRVGGQLSFSQMDTTGEKLREEVNESPDVVMAAAHYMADDISVAGEQVLCGTACQEADGACPTSTSLHDSASRGRLDEGSLSMPQEDQEETLGIPPAESIAEAVLVAPVAEASEALLPAKDGAESGEVPQPEEDPDGVGTSYGADNSAAEVPHAVQSEAAQEHRHSGEGAEASNAHQVDSAEDTKQVEESLIQSGASYKADGVGGTPSPNATGSLTVVCEELASLVTATAAGGLGSGSAASSANGTPNGRETPQMSDGQISKEETQAMGPLATQDCDVGMSPTQAPQTIPELVLQPEDASSGAQIALDPQLHTPQLSRCQVARPVSRRGGRPGSNKVDLAGEATGVLDCTPWTDELALEFASVSDDDGDDDCEELALEGEGVVDFEVSMMPHDLYVIHEIDSQCLLESSRSLGEVMSLPSEPGSPWKSPARSSASSQDHWRTWKGGQEEKWSSVVSLEGCWHLARPSERSPSGSLDGSGALKAELAASRGSQKVASEVLELPADDEEEEVLSSYAAALERRCMSLACDHGTLVPEEMQAFGQCIFEALGLKSLQGSSPTKAKILDLAWCRLKDEEERELAKRRLHAAKQIQVAWRQRMLRATRMVFDAQVKPRDIQEQVLSQEQSDCHRQQPETGALPRPAPQRVPLPAGRGPATPRRPVPAAAARRKTIAEMLQQESCSPRQPSPARGGELPKLGCSSSGRDISISVSASASPRARGALPASYARGHSVPRLPVAKEAGRRSSGEPTASMPSASTGSGLPPSTTRDKSRIPSRPGGAKTSSASPRRRVRPWS